MISWISIFVYDLSPAHITEFTHNIEDDERENDEELKTYGVSIEIALNKVCLSFYFIHSNCTRGFMYIVLALAVQKCQIAWELRSTNTVAWCFSQPTDSLLSKYWL